MMRAGNAESGFAAEVGAFGVRVRAWGFWDAAVAAEFPGGVAEALRVAGQRGQLVIDASRLKPQRAAGQDAFREVVEATAKLPNIRAELVVGNAITKMQLARLLRESAAHNWTLRAPSSAPDDGGPS